MRFLGNSCIVGLKFIYDRQSLISKLNMPIQTVRRSLLYADPIMLITYSFVALLGLIVILIVIWYRRLENVISRNEERQSAEQNLADEEMERVRKESILSALPSKVWVVTLCLNRPCTFLYRLIHDFSCVRSS